MTWEWVVLLLGIIWALAGVLAFGIWLSYTVELPDQADTVVRPYSNPYSPQ